MAKKRKQTGSAGMTGSARAQGGKAARVTTKKKPRASKPAAKRASVKPAKRAAAVAKPKRRGAAKAAAKTSRARVMRGKNKAAGRDGLATVSESASTPAAAPAMTPEALGAAGRPAPSGKVDAARAFAIEAARLLSDDHCEDVLLLDVRGIYEMADYIVIGSGTSDRQMRAVADNLAGAGEPHGYRPYRKDVDERTTWCLIDFVDVVAHIFEPNTRAHYDLEMLWGDAPRIEWRRGPGEAAPARRVQTGSVISGAGLNGAAPAR